MVTSLRSPGSLPETRNSVVPTAMTRRKVFFSLSSVTYKTRPSDRHERRQTWSPRPLLSLSKQNPNPTDQGGWHVAARGQSLFSGLSL